MNIEKAMGILNGMYMTQNNGRHDSIDAQGQLENGRHDSTDAQAIAPAVK